MSQTVVSSRAPSAAARVGVVRYFGWWFVAEHRIRSMRAYLGSLVIIGLGSPFLYLMGLGIGLGILVDQNQGAAGVDGVPYLTFLAPALLLATAMQTSAQENTYGVFGGFKWMPIFLGMQVTPLRPWQIVLGFQVSVLARVVPVTVFFMLAVWALDIERGPNVLLLLPLALLLSLAVGFCVMAWVSTQEDDRGQLSFVDRFVIVPLTLFSGTYFPLATLPIFLQWIGWVSPLWHAVEVSRAALYGSPMTTTMLLVHLGYLTLLVFAGFALSARQFRKRLDV